MGGHADLCDRIGRIFSEGLSLDVPSADIDLFEAAVLDSLAFVELLLRLEQEFGVTVSVDDLEIENFSTIARIAEFVRLRTALASVPSRHARVVPMSARRSS
jgi:D-alanine--poly(phosphoribitol) ligase subunit 2